MPSDNFQQFVLLFFLGLGLLLAAVMNVALRIAPTSHRVAGTMLAGGAATFACRLFEGDANLTRTLAITLAAIATPVFILGTDTGTRWLVAVAERSKRPQAAWWCCGLLGVLTIALAAARYEEREESHVNAQTAELNSLEKMDRTLHPTGYREADTNLTTDLGNPLEAWTPVSVRAADERDRIEAAFLRQRESRDRLIRVAPADERANCYGWVFTGGQHWLPESSLKKILQENGYRQTREPAAGDLIAYQRQGEISHLAIVRYLAPDRPPIVEGKWGMNGVFLHAADVTHYGKDFVFLRSPRAGHLLAGVPNRESPPVEDDRTE